MKNIKIIIFVFVYLLCSIYFSYIIYSEVSSFWTLDKIISIKNNFMDTIKRKQILTYNLIKYEKNNFELEEYQENLFYDLKNNKIYSEVFHKEFYSKSIFSDNLQILYKETYNKEKSETEKIIYMNNYYLFQRLFNDKIKEEKKLKLPESNLILVDILPLALRIFIANKCYETNQNIDIIMGFLQNNYKIPVNIIFNKINSFDELLLDLDNKYLNEFSYNSSILCEIVNKDILKISKFRILYLFSSVEPYFLKLIFYGNKKNFYIVLLKDYQILD